MINYEKVGEKIFAIVKGHNHNLVMFNEEGMETNDASEARRFFVNKPNYMITLDAENRKIKFNKNRHVTLEEIESVMKQIKNLATTNMLKNEVQVFGKEITPKDFAYQAKQFKEANMNDISEASLSRMSGVKKTSYQTLESVKMVVRHRKEVDEDVRGSRSRQISAIFLEQAGERFRFPHNHLAGARAMARHMYEGGNMQDTLGEYIIESVSNMIKLNEFVRYARSNKLMNEANDDVVKTVKENIGTIRTEIKGLTGAKSYARMSETILAREANVLEENDTTELQDMFTVRKFDEKITDVLPLVKRLMDNKQTWRDAILEASKVEIAISEKTELAEQDIFEFENPVQAMGYKVRGIVERMIGESDLSVFVGKVAGKLIEGAGISDFEKNVVSNVLENARIREEEEVCEGCGKIHEDCGCSTKDVVDLISESFALKMKMIEHEDIFEDEKTRHMRWDDVNRMEDSPEKHELRRKKRQGEVRRKIDKSYINQDRKARGSASAEGYDGNIEFREDEDGTPKKPEGEDCETCGGWGEVSTSGKHWRDITHMDDIVGCADCAPVTEEEGEKCDRCRKGTMHKGDTMMGPAKQCDRCGYQLQVNEADRTLADPYEPQQKRECSNCGDFASDLADRHGDDLFYVCDTCGFEETDQIVDLNLAGEVNEADYDDHHAGEMEAGAHMGMPPEDSEGMHIDHVDCEDCEGTGIGLDGVSDCYACDGSGSAGEISADDFDGQPTDYEEMQDFMGGDDWDHGQFDESLNELRKAAGLPIVEISDPAAANECPECKGDGNAQDSIFDDDDCEECGGTGIVESINESDAEKAGSGKVDPEDFMENCPECDGVGEVAGKACEKCGGEGYV